MMKLSALGVKFLNWAESAPGGIARLSTNQSRPDALRRSEAFLVRDDNVPEGFLFYVIVGDESALLLDKIGRRPHIWLPNDFLYLRDGDVIRTNADKNSVRVLYRRASNHNSFLVTERCNHYCLMCSQPPRNVDDSWIIDEIKATIPLMDIETREIGFTGGEPTLLEGRLIEILELAKGYLPHTAVHILSNGRRFSDLRFSQAYANVKHPDIMVGIPIYSDISSIHDYVVQSDGAFDETIRGILNLKRLRQRVEVRIVIHRQTYSRLPQLAYFLARNLTFIDHIALMGLEMMGFAKANVEDLWIDPFDYQRELFDAAMHLNARGMNFSIYNHQLCLLPEELWPFSRKSISDWKNEYMPECADCSERNACGGFFSSARFRHSRNIRPIPSATISE